MSNEKQPIWEQDLMPGKDVVLDFYASELPGQPDRQEQAEWERIEDYEMDSCVPGYTKLAPHQQWRVTSGHQQWMIYQWWSGTGFDDDEYLYSEVHQFGPSEAMEQEVPYTPAASDLALFASMRATEVAGAIMQAHVDGEISLETYKKLYDVAKKSQIAAETLNKRLEKEGKE